MIYVNETWKFLVNKIENKFNKYEQYTMTIYLRSIYVNQIPPSFAVTQKLLRSDILANVFF